jgi:four helix bundle protein
MSIVSFTDLIAWQKARELTKNVYKITKRDEFNSDFALRDQIRRASVSIMSNIAEGFDRAGRRDIHRFLVIAKESCAEIFSQLYVALDAEYLEQKTFERLLEMTKEVSRIVGALRKFVDVK